MALPTTPTVNTVDSIRPDRLRAVIYGRPGHGKTTLAAGWYSKTNLIIDTEGGAESLHGEHFVQRVKSMSEFEAVVNELVAGQHQFTTVTIDTVDSLIRMASAEAGQRYGKVDAAVVDFGKGLGDRDGVVMRAFAKLFSTDLGVILTGYSTSVTQQDEGTGKEATRLFPRLDRNDRIREEIMGLVTFVLFVHRADNGAHTLVTGGRSGVETKRRYTLPDEIVLPADGSGALLLHQAIKAGMAADLAPAPVAA